MEAGKLTVQERIDRLAAHLGVKRGLGDFHVDESMRDRKWYLRGGADGDVVLPNTKHMRLLEAAVRAAEEWLGLEPRGPISDLQVTILKARERKPGDPVCYVDIDGLIRDLG